MKRRAERRSGGGMIFLLDLWRDQVEIRQGRTQFYEYCGEGSSVFSSHEA
jgi:hypothetical protein